jgi:hypothetical protein
VQALGHPSENSGAPQITNSAVHAKWAVVFAQLHIGGKNEGIHGFLVRIRNEVMSNRQLPAPQCQPYPIRYLKVDSARSLCLLLSGWHHELRADSKWRG